MDPAVFGTLLRTQQTVFRMADVLFTGAVLVEAPTSTNSMDSMAALANGRVEPIRR